MAPAASSASAASGTASARLSGAGNADARQTKRFVQWQQGEGTAAPAEQALPAAAATAGTPEVPEGLGDAFRVEQALQLPSPGPYRGHAGHVVDAEGKHQGLWRRGRLVRWRHVVAQSCTGGRLH